MSNPPQVKTHDNEHLARINPDLLGRYKEIIQHMVRRSNSDYHCEVALNTNSNQVMTIGAFREHHADLDEHVAGILDNLTSEQLKFLFSHIDEPILQAISLIKDLDWEHGDSSYVESVIENLQQLLSYHRPYCISYMKESDE
ncbi:MAG: hypothetical protein GY861_06655 [bacterium]|nr:hypothetical protein [bacterium]